MRNKLKDSNLEMAEARKRRRRERAKGGIVFGTRKGLVVDEEEEEEEEIFNKTDETIAVRFGKKRESTRIIRLRTRERRKRRQVENRKRLFQRQRNDRYYDRR